MNKNYLTGLLLIVCIPVFVFQAKAQQNLGTATIYTTAKDTGLRLEMSGTANFQPGEQALETVKKLK